jgi:FMN-dependent oxidoreductase (nitrilotriacetate monooxygenase family)
MRLCAFASINGYFEGAWRLPGADPHSNVSIDHFREFARTAERADLDAVFIADGLALWADVRRRPTGTFEPSVLAASMLDATHDIGVIISLSTTFSEPYDVARRLGSLDHLSGGRIGWNIVTSTSDEAARNFGLDTIPPHEERYARCGEFIEVCLRLWRSWAPGAVAADKAGWWADPDLVQAINHEGRWFRVAGPLDVPRSPQVVPMLVQAGSSDDGVGIAAEHADAVFTVQDDLATARAFAERVRSEASARGRTRAPSILPGVVPVLGATEDEAAERLEQIEALVDEQLAVRALEDRLELDAGSLALDRPIEHALPGVEAEQGNRTIYEVLRHLATDGATVREVVRKMHAGRGHLTLVGTGEQVADTMCLWFERQAADGFNVLFPSLPDDLERFAREVVPILRDRGLLGGASRTGGEPPTLRERFEAPYPDVS